MKALSFFASLLILAACGGVKAADPAPAKTGASALANGRDIFLTGRDAAGANMTAARPPLRPSCAACHRADGSGGVHLPGGAVSADLRHNALVNEQKRPYTFALLERAISTGVDNMGESLHRDMPRWRMTKRDLHDVSEYVFTQLH